MSTNLLAAIISTTRKEYDAPGCEMAEMVLQANLGGAPSRKAWVYAYLRLREKDAGPLDFDSPGGADTTWHRIFLCLRAGYQQEAVEVR